MGQSCMSLNTVLLQYPDLNMNRFILHGLILLCGYFQVIIRLLQCAVLHNFVQTGVLGHNSANSHLEQLYTGLVLKDL